ncbi:MAG TPA: hypothetical protein VN894_00210, partial [Polyangiaceae bacterium]|nr:hypothetical protein [Polyangiaceae bacterium]
ASKPGAASEPVAESFAELAAQPSAPTNAKSAEEKIHGREATQACGSIRSQREERYVTAV